MSRREPFDPYRLPRAVTVFAVTSDGAIGVDGGPFRDGRWTWAEGRRGRIGLDLVRAEHSGRYTLGATGRGARIDGLHRGQVTLVGAVADLKRLEMLADTLLLTQAGLQGRAQAFAGGDAVAAGGLAAGRRGLHAVGSAQAFAGVKARAEATFDTMLCGLALTATGIAEASAGAGAAAAGHFKVDWSRFAVRIGGEANATLGPGAGIGGVVDVSVEQIVRKPRRAAGCAVYGLAISLATPAGTSSIAADPVIRAALFRLAERLLAPPSLTNGITAGANVHRAAPTTASPRAGGGSSPAAGLKR